MITDAQGSRWSTADDTGLPVRGPAVIRAGTESISAHEQEIELPISGDRQTLDHKNMNSAMRIMRAEYC
ncbi:hypothetical protein [Nocardia cyriacigeorgica]|uniref:hypothetical protein n=1 Tax=Nocardia cyriacigeorgica TaxID=135487 RepID=UPI0011D1A328|nr:hypothetical protein [Nocardia cyriacigeorgica]MBF6423808.1 hypothetical protein [Nocardia cyriacigeorgica]